MQVPLLNKLPLSVLGPGIVTLWSQIQKSPFVTVWCRTRFVEAALLPRRPLRIVLESDGPSFRFLVG